MTTALTTRITAGTGATVKGSPLTSAEIDNNFISLNNNKLEGIGSSSITTLGTVTTGTWNASVITGQYGGTGTSTAFTTGSVVFAGASGTYTQDNANFFWDDTNNRLGIGTASPATKLHLLTSSATAVALRAGNSASYAEFQVDASGNSQLIAPGGVQIFNTNGAERMRIDSSGNVGIGTSTITSPYKLQVIGSIKAGYVNANGTVVDGSSIEIGADGTGNRNAFIDFHADDTYTDYALRIIRNNNGSNADSVIDHRGTGLLTLSCAEAGAINFKTSSTERMRIDSSGNVGIGTTSPAGKLDVIGSIKALPAATQDAVIIAGRAGGTSSYSATLTPTTLTASRTITLPDTTTTMVGTDATQTLTNKTLTGAILNGTLGATTPSTVAGTTGIFSSQVCGVTTVSDHGIRVTAPSGDATPAIFQFTNFAKTVELVSLNATANTLTVTASTGLVCSGNVTAYSDTRIKNNLKKINSPLEKVEQLNGYTFDRTDIVTPRQTGLLAQEVLKVLPEAVIGSEDTIYSVAYGNLMGLMVEAIKELNAKISKLENK